ncbi:MAG TPA: hydroxysqualene dehydroxylase HpnE [Planctomycetaceae bacterium]|jgi:squalene-associated FAD-dependent desaturase
MSKHVVIVGGGLAGLAAAVGLAGRPELRVTLCESRPRWGGRASSFVDQTTGEPIDNCQHVALGCCTNFRHFCQAIGIESLFCREDELVFVAPDGRASRMAAAPWPAPLHLAPAFARFGFLSWHDKYRLGLGLRALARTDPALCEGVTFLDWLHRHGQTQTNIDRFWHVVLVSALSETLDRIDVGHARKVFVDAFIANRHGWEVWLPTAPLDELYGPRLEAWLAARNVTPRLQSGAKQLLFDPGRTNNAAGSPSSAPAAHATGVELRSGERIDADEVILAVPQNLVLPLLPEACRAHPRLAGIDRLETAPISSVHLWFDRPITKLRHATFVGKQSQWLFNRSAIQATCAGQAGAVERAITDPQPQNHATPPGPPLLRGGELDSALRTPNSELHYYQVVISASRDVVEAGNDQTIRMVVDELAGVWPIVREARLVHSRLVTEHKAVVSMLPGVDKLRPPQQSPIDNLQLAGDWTQTGWPGTMEGAVRSGYLAAENVLRRCGTPQRLVQSDLPVALLSKLLFGL